MNEQQRKYSLSTLFYLLVGALFGNFLFTLLYPADIPLITLYWAGLVYLVLYGISEWKKWGNPEKASITLRQISEGIFNALFIVVGIVIVLGLIFVYQVAHIWK